MKGALSKNFAPSRFIFLIFFVVFACASVHNDDDDIINDDDANLINDDGDNLINDDDDIIINDDDNIINDTSFNGII